MKTKKIEPLDVVHMLPFPDGSVYDTIKIAHKVNEIIEALAEISYQLPNEK